MSVRIKSLLWWSKLTKKEKKGLYYKKYKLRDILLITGDHIEILYKDFIMEETKMKEIRSYYNGAFDAIKIISFFKLEEKLTEEEIKSLVILQIKKNKYFSSSPFKTVLPKFLKEVQF